MKTAEAPKTKPCPLEPMEDCMVVQRDEAAKVTPGGIYLPDVGKQRATRGTILRVGPGKLNDKADPVLHTGQLPRLPMAYKVGDRVIFSTYAGNEVEYEGVEYLIMRQADVLAKIP